MCRNVTMIPNFYLDHVMPFLNETENKVYLYLCRRIFGYQKNRAVGMACVPLSDFVEGRMKDGEVYDNGGLLSRSAASRALNSLKSLGLICEIEQRRDGKVWAIGMDPASIGWEALHDRHRTKKRVNAQRLAKALEVACSSMDVALHKMEEMGLGDDVRCSAGQMGEVPSSGTEKVRRAEPCCSAGRTAEFPPDEPLESRSTDPTPYIERKNKERGKEKGQLPPFVDADSSENLGPEVLAVRDRILHDFGQTALAGQDTLEGIRTLKRATSVALTLTGMGYGDAQAVQRLIQRFRTEDWRGRSQGTEAQLLAFASQLQEQRDEQIIAKESLTINFESVEWMG